MNEGEELVLKEWGVQRNWYRGKIPEMKNFFRLLAEKELKRGMIKHWSEITKININTVRTWRRHLLADPEYMPYSTYGVTTLDKSVEDNFSSHLKDDYINVNLPLTRGEVCDLAIDVYRACSEDMVHRHNFAASYSWLRRFAHANGVTFRKPHGQKRGVVDFDAAKKYIHHLRSVYRRYAESRIFNMDETAFSTCNDHSQVLSLIGSDCIPGGQNGDPKECFTVIVTISKACRMLPLWYIAEGTTDRCHKQFGDECNFVDEEVITHSENGWSTESIMLDYLPWMKEQAGGPCALVWDIFRAHCTDKVRDKARALEIELVFVPANGTAIYQPCDLRIMGILKKMSQMEWEIARRRGRNKVVWNKSSAAVVCSNVLLNNISPFAIGQAWGAISHINDPDFVDDEVITHSENGP